MSKNDGMMNDIIVEECTNVVTSDYLADEVNELISSIKNQIGGTDYLARKVLINYLEGTT